MPDPNLSNFLLHREFDNFDDLAAEFVKWDLDLRQLDCGRFVGELLYVSAGRVLFGESRFGRCLLQQGSVPTGMRTFGIPADPTMRFQWR